MSILSGIALCCALFWAPKTLAGSLYQCTGSSGEAVFSSSKVGYQHCKVISTYAEPAPRRRRSPPPGPKASLNGVTGSVRTTAWQLAADGSIPTSLERVTGSVEGDARLLGDAGLKRESLAAVRGTVETNAQRIALTDVGGSVESITTVEVSGAEPPLAADAPKSAKSVVRASRSAGRTYYYKVVHPDGSMYLGDNSPQMQEGDVLTKTFVEYIATCAACNLHSTVRWGSVSLNLTAYADTIRSASVEYGVDEAFLRAIIHAESAFNPRALSLKGAQGLMQLMPGTASDMGVLDAFNSDQNIRGGARYLSLLLHNFDGDERLAAAAYNAGPGAVQRYKGVPPYAETRVYVERVGTLRKRYGEAIHRPLAANGSG